MTQPNIESTPNPEEWVPLGEPVTCVGDGLPVTLSTRSLDSMLRVEFFRGIYKHYGVEDVELLGEGDYRIGAVEIGKFFVLNSTGRVNAPQIALREVLETLHPAN